MPDASTVAPLLVALPGGRTLTLTPDAKFASKQSCDLLVEGGGMPPVPLAGFHPTKINASRVLANEALLSPSDIAVFRTALVPWLRAASDTLAAAREAKEAEAAAKAAMGDPMGGNLPAIEIRQRHINATDEQALTFPAASSGDLLAILRKPAAPDTVVYWAPKHAERFACVDLDFHARGVEPPLPGDLDRIARDIQPAPAIWWRTQGGGLRLVYEAFPPYTAEELAVGAMAALLNIHIVAKAKGTAEVLTRTRHPSAVQKGKNCGPIRTCQPTDAFDCLARFNHAGATEAEVEEVMEEKGYTLGERLDHSHCVIDPGHASNSPNPVVISEHGIYCHSCAGRLGDGFRSWGWVRRKEGLTLDASEATAPITNALKHLVHWRQGAYYLKALAPDIAARFRRTLWCAMLKRTHNGDSLLVQAAMGWDFNYVRGPDGWLHASTLRPAKTLTMAGVRILPFCQGEGEDEDGNPTLVPRPGRIEDAINNGPLDGHHPIRGNYFQPVFFEHNPVAMLDGALLCVPEAAPKKPRVQYLPHSERCTMAEAERIIGAYFPGCDFTYLKALIIAMGCAESQVGTVPMLWATGETGSAKTTQVQIITEMYGEIYSPLVELEESRRGQAFGEAMQNARLVVLDDFAKKEDEYPALQSFILHLNRAGFSHHRMYVGPTTEKVNSAVVLTDWNLPPFFSQDLQFGRRVHLVRLKGAVPDWAAMGHMVEEWWQSSPELTKAAQSFHSHLVDEFFPKGEKPVFNLLMKRLGVRLVRDEEGADLEEARGNRLAFFRDLITALVTAPLPSESTKQRVGTAYQEVRWDSGSIGKPAMALVESLGAVEPNAANLTRVLQDLNREIPKLFVLADPSATVKVVAKAYGRGQTFIRIEEAGSSKHRRIGAAVFSTCPPTPVEAAPQVTAQVTAQVAPEAAMPPLTLEAMMAALRGWTPPTGATP